MNFVSILAEKIYRIANFSKEDRDRPLHPMDAPGLTETANVLAEAFTLWQIVLIDNLNGDFDDLSNSEIAELQGSRNTIFQGVKELAISHATEALNRISEEHREEFFDKETLIVIETKPNADLGTVISATIGDELFAEATVYPVEITTA